MPIQYYDPAWWNNRLPHARAKIAPKLVVAFVPGSTDFFSRRGDNKLSVAALTAKYGAKVFADYDLDYETAKEPAADASDDSRESAGETVGSQDSDNAQSLRDDASMGSFLSDDGEDGADEEGFGSDEDLDGEASNGGEGRVGGDSENMAQFAEMYGVPMEDLDVAEDLEGAIFGVPGEDSD
ncbi:hypothetical protein B0H16DRAFT_1557609 [Mycena metata]|uniref:Uncharacterized protein n=1 Tax=Mycena metata TaxID=1033252 RepID=A0AAD7IPK5_9AGAR|nr:hypothetical protein B0H16DRAFT_1557609 [Mycena metata]